MGRETWTSETSSDHEKDDDKDLLRKLGARGVVLNSIADILRLNKLDEYIKQLVVIAGVLAYFKIVFECIIESFLCLSNMNSSLVLASS